MLSSLIPAIIATCIPAHTPPVELIDALAKVPDPRNRRGVRYTVARRGTVPTLSSIHRITALVNPVILEASLHEWVRTQVAEEPIAIDGKEVRGAKQANGARVFFMAAVTHHTACVIGQESIGEKTNEIPHFTPLLDQLGDLSGRIITADALHTQHAHADAVHERGAHYVFTVKGNQRGLYDRIASQTWASRPTQHSLTQDGTSHPATPRRTHPRALDHRKPYPLGTRRHLRRRPFTNPHRHHTPAHGYPQKPRHHHPSTRRRNQHR